MADVFDCLTSTRSYRKAWSTEAAIAELRRCAGTQFDPRMVEALVRAVEREGWEVPDLVEPVEDACEPCTAQPVGASEAAPETVPTGAAQTAADGDTQTDTNLTVGVVEETTG